MSALFYTQSSSQARVDRRPSMPKYSMHQARIDVGLDPENAPDPEDGVELMDDAPEVPDFELVDDEAARGR